MQGQQSKWSNFETGDFNTQTFPPGTITIGPGSQTLPFDQDIPIVLGAQGTVSIDNNGFTLPLTWESLHNLRASGTTVSFGNLVGKYVSILTDPSTPVDVHDPFGGTNVLQDRLKGLCLNCQPMEPEAGVAFLETPYSDTTGLGYSGKIPTFVVSPTAIESARIKGCSKAVTGLRTFSPGGLGDNAIDDFNRSCMFASEDLGSLEVLSDMQVETVSKCSALYDAYAKSCLSTPTAIASERIVNRIGVIVGTSGPVSPALLCTATLINTNTIVTARHCFLRSLLQQVDDVTNDFTAYFLPNPGLAKAANQIVSPDQIVGEVSSAGVVSNIQLLGSPPDTSNDVIFVRLAENLPLDPTLHIRVGQISMGDRLTMVGYHEFLGRSNKLHSRLSFSPIQSVSHLLESGDWATNLFADDSPLCFAAYSDDYQIQHLCQSFNGTSGAPLFSGDVADSGTSVVTLVAVQSSGELHPDELKGDLNIAAVINPTFAPIFESGK
ncbi:trypsin-like serine peptidase [Phyllobacterium chamaecytisi]|uniref:trypsin-like serine peptidase n=1 Tax=Phyllobacterium chamaecytisi TaxID=2876082 RepID=UPI001CCD03E3|nr:trypsin-like peptidase domain-containing protein [Phyllobacterium sp. KW56]MBZ9603318.1 S1 family peptidase [Phyllobacterium sp. KW56]